MQQQPDQSSASNPFAGSDPITKPAISHVMNALAVLCLYVGGWVVSMIIGVATGAFEEARNATDGSRPDMTPAQIFMASAALGGMLLAFIAYGILMFRMWSAISPANATLTPGTATAISVIPLVNLVGMFLAFVGLTHVINRDAAARGLPNVRVSHGLALSACICKLFGILGCIPIIGCIFGLVAFVGAVLWFVSMFQMAIACDKLITRPVAYGA